MSLSYQEVISDLKSASHNLDIASYFYNLLYNKSINYHINGYSIICMQPPDLSGLGLSPQTILDMGIIDNILFAVEFSGGENTIETSQAQGYIPYASNTTSTNSVSCSYIDSDQLHIFDFHKTWRDYIKAVRLGEQEPSAKYWSNNELDYVASIYAVTFKSDLSTPVYTSKAIGCFPTGNNDNEIIGSRSSNEIAITSVSYNCAAYKMEVGKGKLYGEFMSDIGNKYK